MNSKTSALTSVFGTLLAVTLVGILVHQFSGYGYPVSPAADFEFNVLGDIYEAAVLVPLGVTGIVALRKGMRCGIVLVVGVTFHFTYNYAMAVTGRQNLWIFLWVAKLALSGAVMCLAWPMLPTGVRLPAKSRRGTAVYLALVVLVFSKMMGQRLIASASGRVVDMTMQQGGAVDWGDPILRDPVVFFSLVVPVMGAAVLGLLKGTEWGGRAGSASCALVVSIVSVALFTGPLKEFIMTRQVSPPVLMMSGIMLLAASPGAWFLRKLAQEDRRQ